MRGEGRGGREERRRGGEGIGLRQVGGLYFDFVGVVVFDAVLYCIVFYIAFFISHLYYVLCNILPS